MKYCLSPFANCNFHNRPYTWSILTLLLIPPWVKSKTPSSHSVLLFRGRVVRGCVSLSRFRGTLLPVSSMYNKGEYSTFCSTEWCAYKQLSVLLASNHAFQMTVMYAKYSNLAKVLCYTIIINISNVIQWNLSIKDTVNKGHLSNEDTVCNPNHIYRAVYKSNSELGTPLYTGQPAGSQWCPL